MSRVVVLDSGPLGLLCARVKQGSVAAACSAWLTKLVRVGVRVIVPEITDYEVRRELIRAGKTSSVARLDSLAATIEYLPLTTAVMRKAADIWAQARKAGKPTASDKSIDADVILAAQATMLGVPSFVVATSNVGHISRYVPAEDWKTITA